MKARLWQTLFLLNTLIISEMSFAEDANKDVRDLKEQNIMSVLYQQTAAERLASSLQTFSSAKRALDKALADPSWSALPGQNVKDKKTAIIVDIVSSISTMIAVFLSLTFWSGKALQEGSAKALSNARFAELNVWRLLANLSAAVC